MTQEELNQYIAKVTAGIKLDRYVPRRFVAAEANGNLPADFDYRFHGLLRGREPQLEELITHPRVMVLAEPGGGKSVIACAAVLAIIAKRDRVAISVELKGYRSDLGLLLRQCAPAELLDPAATVDGAPIRRAYVFDGVDEIPPDLLGHFVSELATLAALDRDAQMLLTARQAFYVSNQARLPDCPAVFHILGFSDEDIRDYVRRSELRVDEFMEALMAANATEEVRNPFILSIIVERFRQSGGLSKKRSENVSYMIDHLIQKRPRIDQHRQRRALRMLGIAMETWCRNELTEEEALRVIKQSMRISPEESKDILNELYASILKRTANGLAFQTRSFGEYLAAEELENQRLHRIRELAFVDYTPNDSWLNAMSYLAELNGDVRQLFIRQYPFWMIHASPAAFSREEKDTIVTKVLTALTTDAQYITEHPQIQGPRLARLVTDAMEARLIGDLKSPSDIGRGNALILLGLRAQHEALPVALAVIKDKSLGVRLRQCALIALTNVGGPEHVRELLPLLDDPDPLEVNLCDLVGSIANESQLAEILARVLHSNTFLTSTYYHFREFTSRSALVEVLRYLIANPEDLNAIRSEGYIEPILCLMEQYWDGEIAKLCVDLLERIEARLIYPDPSGSMRKFFDLVRKTDNEGLTARLYFERALLSNDTSVSHVYFVDQIAASLMTPATARWVVEKKATALIKRMAGYVHGEIREILRPHSDGLIDAQDANAQAYREEEVRRQHTRKLEMESLKEHLLSQTVLQNALSDFAQLSEAHWPELPESHRNWLAAAVSKQMVDLDLEHRVVWNGDTLTQPQMLSLLMRIVDRYEFKLDPDEPLIFAITGWATDEAIKYYRRFGLSGGAVALFERLLTNPPSSGALQGIVSFLREATLNSEAIDTALMAIVTRPLDKEYVQVDALNILIRHDVENELLVQLEATGLHANIRERAFQALVERQHRATIERNLSRLMLNDDELKAGEVAFHMDSPLSWITKIRTNIAWEKLANLRERALRLAFPNVVAILTETLAKINRKDTAALMRRQIAIAPESWRPTQQFRATEQERQARIEEAQCSPFEVILRKLGGATSINRLKLLCEGSTDESVFKALIAQVPDTPEIIVHDVGGWDGLRKKDPNILLLGCKEAILVMDGDNGRDLKKRNKPFTKSANEERKRLAGFPIEFFVLERYGIENYFPRSVMEKILKRDLSTYFPIPEDAPVTDYFSAEYRTLWYRLRVLCAAVLRLERPSASRSLYRKSLNADVAKLISLDNDLLGSDLASIVLKAAQKAKELSDE